MDKRYIIIGAGLLLIIVMAIILLVTRNNNEPVAKENNLVIWSSSDTEDDFSFAIELFTDEHPDVDVSFVKKNPATYEADSLNALASGEGPDVWIIPSAWMAKEQNKLSIMPEKTLDSKGKKTNAQSFKETFVSAAYDDIVINNQVYGLPLYIDTLSLYFNSNIMQETYSQYAKDHPKADLAAMQKLLTNPPATWNDLSNIIKYHGTNTITLGTADIENSTDILTVLLMQFGAQMTSNDKSSALFHTSTNLVSGSAYPGAQALSFYTSFAKKGDSHYTWDPSLGSAYNAFVKQQVPMMIGYGSIYKQLSKDASTNPEIAALPQLNKGSHIDLAKYEVLTVPKSSQASTLAWSFITSVVNSSSNFLGQYLDAKHVLSPFKSQNDSTSDEDFDQIQVKNAQTWYNPDPAKVETIFKNAINQSLSGQNAQTIIEGAAAQVSTLLTNLKGNQ